MAQIKRDNFMAVLPLILGIVFLVAGCAEKRGSDRVIVTINDYKMTIEDFNCESSEVLNMAKVLGETPVTKQDMLDALITKELLLQEAQGERLDREKDFMKTIELYWKQTLLKNLLTQKSEEIARVTTVYKDEIRNYYDKMKSKIKAMVILCNNEKSARQLLECKDNIREYAEKEPEKYSIKYIIPSKWYVLGKEETPFEYSILSIDVSKGKGITRLNKKWAVIVVEEIAPNEVGSFLDLKEDITRRIKERKEKEVMNEWINALRSKARVRIDKRIFDSLN
jgi:hypothetical protein